MSNVDFTELNKRWQHPWLLCHRVRLHDTLMRMATSVAGEGPPAQLHTSSKVADVDPEIGTVTLGDGTRTDSADLIIGADGIYVRHTAECMTPMSRALRS